MSSKKLARQGIAWDQLALESLGGERRMGEILKVNISEMDALLFSGGISVAIPDVPEKAVKSLPPWERM